MEFSACAEAFISGWNVEGNDGESVEREGADYFIEFIGDSYFVGYGNLLPGTAEIRDGLSPEQVGDYTDCHLGMAALCGVLLDRARCTLGANGRVASRVFARSGRGIVRNYPSLTDRVPLPETYCSGAHRDGPIPQLIVINLGINDLSTALEPWESFTGQAQLSRAFVDRYHQFITELERYYAGVKLLLVGIPHPQAPQHKQLLQQIYRERRMCGTAVYYCALPVVPLDGCDAHPGLAGHRQCAQALTEAVLRILSPQECEPALEKPHG